MVHKRHGIAAAFAAALLMVSVLMVIGMPALAERTGSIGVNTNKGRYVPGEPVVISIVNSGNETLEGTPSCVILNEAGRVIYSFVFTMEIRVWEPGQGIRVVWDQRTDTGARARPGTYHAAGSFAGHRDSSRFLISRFPGGADPPEGGITVNTNKDRYVPGEPVVISIVNSGTETLEGTPSCVILNEAGRVIYSFVFTMEVRVWEPGQGIRVVWDQRTDADAQVRPGTYHAAGSFAGHSDSSRFVVAEGPRPVPKGMEAQETHEIPLTTGPPAPEQGSRMGPARIGQQRGQCILAMFRLVTWIPHS